MQLIRILITLFSINKIKIFQPSKKYKINNKLLLQKIFFRFLKENNYFEKYCTYYYKHRYEFNMPYLFDMDEKYIFSIQYMSSPFIPIINRLSDSIGDKKNIEKELLEVIKIADEWDKLIKKSA